MDEQIQLENEVTASLNYSTLVEEIGGLGTYPTMVQQTSDLNWMLEVIAHEWTHNYLGLRPLGLNYDLNSDLRTINETAASIAGKEISVEVIKTYYPELLPPEPEPAKPDRPESSTLHQETPEEPDTKFFDFRAEMRITRVTTDDLLTQGKIAEAEQYMEDRRQMFWNHGYPIRKLNQAYFAFHGAYADTPGGAAGEDPVGEAVRELRAYSASLSQFVNRISRVNSIQQLNLLVQISKPGG